MPELCERVTRVSEREVDAHGRPSLKDHAGKDAVLLMEALWFPRPTAQKQAIEGKVSKGKETGLKGNPARTVKGQCRDIDFRGREPALQSGGMSTGLYNKHRAGNQSMEGGCSGHSIWSQYHRSMTQAGDTDLTIPGCQIPLLFPETSWTSHRQALLLLLS